MLCGLKFEKNPAFQIPGEQTCFRMSNFETKPPLILRKTPPHGQIFRKIRSATNFFLQIRSATKIVRKIHSKDFGASFGEKMNMGKMNPLKGLLI